MPEELKKLWSTSRVFRWSVTFVAVGALMVLLSGGSSAPPGGAQNSVMPQLPNGPQNPFTPPQQRGFLGSAWHFLTGQ